VRRSPDIPDRNPPRIKEQTRQAINAAGGLRHIRECNSEALQWAKKGFIEAYLRWAELEQDKYLLPEGEIRTQIEQLGEAKCLSGLLTGQ